MAGSALTARKFREHARLLRSEAKDMADLVDQQAFQSIAANYEYLASTIELLTRESRRAVQS